MLGDATLATAINTQPRKISCKLDFGNNDIITDVKLLTYGSDWTGTITVGQVVSSYISVTVPTPYFSLSGVNVSLSMGVGTSSVTWTKIGEFRVDEESIRTKQGYTTFNAYDKLEYAVNTYSSTGDKTLQTICNEVCAALGITSTTLPYSITIDSSILDGYTLRDVLGFIAGYCGKNAYLSPNGVLELRWFSSASYTADGTRANIPYIGENDCTIRRWICQTQEGTLTSGSGQGLYFTCPFMTQAQLDSLAANQQLMAYRKADVDIPYGNYLLQAGDIITVSTTGSNLTVPIMENSWKYDGGLSSTVSSFGAADYTGTANNAHHSVSALRVGSILAEHKAANRVIAEIEYATELITGAQGGVMRINMGANGKPAELLILDTGNIATAQRVFRLNENGLGYSSTGYNGSYQAAMTYDGHLVADVIAGTKISGVAVESTDVNSQVLVTNGQYLINSLYNDVPTLIGRIGYERRTDFQNLDTVAIETAFGNMITWGTIGDAPDLTYFSDPPSGSVPFHIYKTIRFYGDVEVQNISDSNNSHLLVDIITELQQKVQALENALGNI